MGRSPKRTARKVHLARSKHLTDVAKEQYEECLRLINACSNLETAVDNKRSEIKVYRQFVAMVRDILSNFMPLNAFKRAAFSYLRRVIARPGKDLTHSQIAALNNIFDRQVPAGGSMDRSQLNDWFVAQHPNFAEGAPLAANYDVPPPAGTVLADEMEAAVGVLTQATKTALDEARSTFEESIKAIFQSAENKTLSEDEVREVAMGLIAHNNAYGHIYFGI